mgnify:CR=1 FL=1
MSRGEFIRKSLETNLFFQRIMKEHLLFIETDLQPVEAANIEEAKILKDSFEELLAETVTYANGIVSEDALRSNEFVTPYTLKAEEVYKTLTGASINTVITRAELALTSGTGCCYPEWLEQAVYDINARSLNLLGEVIAFKHRLIRLAMQCKIFLSLYPELLVHITEEAEYYEEILQHLQNKMLPNRPLCGELNFWNKTMGEHAEFIEGMLDPTEKALKKTAENFAKRFVDLVEECNKSHHQQIIQKSLKETKEIRDFKRAATEGLLQCQIKSIIPPLLADHVLREANYYLRILTMLKM